jgi:hypothetical protein
MSEAICGCLTVGPRMSLRSSGLRLLSDMVAADLINGERIWCPNIAGYSASGYCAVAAYSIQLEVHAKRSRIRRFQRYIFEECLCKEKPRSNPYPGYGICITEIF